MPSLSGVLFGEGPSVDTQTLTTLSPEQQQVLNSLLRSFGQEGLTGFTGDAFPGDLNVGLSQAQQTSLAGLEQRALELASGPSEGQTAAQNALRALLDFEGQTADTTDFFRTNIQEPALEEFEEEVLPRIGRQFGGVNLFGSERQEADTGAREELLGGLTRERSRVALGARSEAKQQALQAAGLIGDVETQRTRELAGIFDVGGQETALRERNLEREFADFTRGQEERRIRINQILASLGVETLENIVTVRGGSEGALQAFLGGISDIRLKKDVRFILETGDIRWYSWTWKIPIAQPTFGVIAQEIQVIRPDVVHTGPDGFLRVDYDRI